MSRLLPSLLAGTLFWQVGCGYTLVRPGSALPQDVRRVYVAVDTSTQGDPETVDTLARALRRVLRRDGRFTVAASPGEADAVLRVEIYPARVEPVAFDEFDEVLDYEMTIRARATLARRDGKSLWTGADIGATRAHAAVPGAIVTTSSAFQASERLTAADLAAFDTVRLGEVRKEHALRTLAVDLAETIYGRMTEGR